MPCSKVNTVSIVVAGIFASCSVRYVHHSETYVIFLYSFVAFPFCQTVYEIYLNMLTIIIIIIHNSYKAHIS